jgi:antitoxin component YwqK of YwqJK toxin-antitoxin module
MSLPFDPIIDALDEARGATDDPSATGLRPRWAGDGPSLNGRRHGRWTFIAGDGRRRQLDFRLGVAHGVYAAWHSNGAKETVGEFCDGRPHGRWAEWHDDGSIASQSEFHRGVPCGTWKSWGRHGRLRRKVDYRDGLPARDPA